MKHTIPSANCTRCGKLCQRTTGNPTARPLRRTMKKKGLCANCAITGFIKSMQPLMRGIEKNGAESLLNPVVQAGYSKMLAAGESEVRGEIDWKVVVKNWDMGL